MGSLSSLLPGKALSSTPSLLPHPLNPHFLHCFRSSPSRNSRPQHKEKAVFSYYGEFTAVRAKTKAEMLSSPWPVWLSGLAITQAWKVCKFHFLVRAHACIAHWIPWAIQEVADQCLALTSVFLSLPPTPLLPSSV